ncbi:hypothetical protein IQ265_05435 [Nodosilinea sp. LEGE 06152]|uniref:hypothetical protein n=1 Tax=Nodosilinea sp. LEGE 06152 TaxID=2777966 RepID=UPI001882A669|nr:hypothetical protein [Nodosilinea sp. LEGE 06152]MBE9156274.1 hypothetical protein [Nodosilinea sp. LEGE 06152]
MGQLCGLVALVSRRLPFRPLHNLSSRGALAVEQAKAEDSSKRLSPISLLRSPL